jgi:hypothetical protein
MPECQHEEDKADPEDALVAAHLLQGAQRIGALPVEGPAVLDLKRFRQEEIGDDKIEECDQRRTEEWHTRAKLAQQSPNDRSQNKADAERNPEKAKVLGAVLVRTDIGNIG